MISETKACQWIISEAAAKAGDAPVEIGRVDTIEHSKAIAVRLPKQKDPIALTVEMAKDFGDAIQKAVALAETTAPAATPA